MDSYAYPLRGKLKRWSNHTNECSRRTLHHSKAKSPLDSKDHPETHTTKFLGKDGIQMYQSLIGSMKWAISIGHFHIAVHVMTMSSF
jgi:hypothetical protein